MTEKKRNIPILVTLDKNYIPQLRVLLTSLYVNHPGQAFDIYLLHSRIPEENLEKLEAELKNLDFNLIPIRADENIFNTAKVTDRYPKEMYYRLLAAQWLPDQDVLNAMFGEQILKIPDIRWNYDARNFNNYVLRSVGKYDLEWVMQHTSVLHFCGRDKPWKKNYRKQFAALYRHYMNLTEHYLKYKIK